MWFSCHTFSYLLSFTCFPLRSHVIPFVITCSPFLSHVIHFIITCLTLLVSIHRLLHNPVHTDSSLSFPSYWLFLFFLSHRHSLITSLYIVPCILASSSFWSCLVFALPCTHLLGIYFALLSLPSSTLWVVSLAPLQPSPSSPYPKAGVFFVSLLAWASLCFHGTVVTASMFSAGHSGCCPVSELTVLPIPWSPEDELPCEYSACWMPGLKS